MPTSYFFLTLRFHKDLFIMKDERASKVITFHIRIDVLIEQDNGLYIPIEPYRKLSYHISISGHI